MKTVIVTGGAGGIGSAVVRRFAKGGYTPIIGYCVSGSEAEALAEETGGIAVRCDVRNPSDTEAIFAEADRLYGRVDSVVNNAGAAYTGLITSMSEEDWQRIIDINLSGVFRISKAAAGMMLRRHQGSIVNITSMWGECGASCEAAYSAAKAGVIGLTKAMAKELGPSGIRVNCVSPGLIDTKMNAELSESDLRALEDDTPLSRIGRPEEVADAVYFLAENASFITGHVLGVSGGFLI